MWLFIHNYNHISCLLIWMFIRFSMKHILFSVWRSLVNNSLKDFLFFDNLLTIAIFALVGLIDDLSCSITILTWSSWLRIHTRAKHSHSCYHTSTFTLRACRIFAVFTTCAITHFTYPVPIYCNFSSFSLIDLFKSYFDGVLNRFSFLWTSCTSTSTKWSSTTSKEWFEWMSTSTSSLFNTFFSVSIVELPLICIWENFVGGCNQFEFFRITALIWMLL